MAFKGPALPLVQAAGAQQHAQKYGREVPTSSAEGKSLALQVVQTLVDSANFVQKMTSNTITMMILGTFTITDYKNEK